MSPWFLMKLAMSEDDHLLHLHKGDQGHTQVRNEDTEDPKSGQLTKVGEATGQLYQYEFVCLWSTSNIFPVVSCHGSKSGEERAACGSEIFSPVRQEAL